MKKIINSKLLRQLKVKRIILKTKYVFEFDDELTDNIHYKKDIERISNILECNISDLRYITLRTFDVNRTDIDYIILNIIKNIPDYTIESFMNDIPEEDINPNIIYQIYKRNGLVFKSGDLNNYYNIRSIYIFNINALSE
jgi:hypothetical protein